MSLQSFGTYYSPIMLSAFWYLLCSKLCQHNYKGLATSVTLLTPVLSHDFTAISNILQGGGKAWRDAFKATIISGYKF